jgi:DNA-binding response OmpR family regulator
LPSQEEQNGRFLHRPQQDYPAATVAEFCTAVLNGRSVILSRQIFPVFERLLEKAMSRDQVASQFQIEGTTAREAKDLIRELRDAFKAAGLTDAESKALIVTVRGRGYRLGVAAANIVIEG